LNEEVTASDKLAELNGEEVTDEEISEVAAG
jgi:hypothetical protein